MMSTELFNALEEHLINLEFDDTITYEGESIFGAVYGKAIGFYTNHGWQAQAGLNNESYALKTTKELAAAVEKLCATVLLD